MKHTNAIFKVAIGFLMFLAHVNPALACSDGSRDSIRSPGGDLRQASLAPAVEFDAQHNLLKVTAQGQTIINLLAEITDETNIQFTGYISDCERVTVHFDFLPLDTALTQVLKGRNYVLSRPANQGTIRVWVLPAGNTDTPTTTEILVQQFYKEFKGLPETERFAEELKLVEQELSGTHSVGRDMQIPESVIQLGKTLVDESF